MIKEEPMPLVQLPKINRAPPYLSLSSCGGLRTEEALATCAAAGIQHVELAIGVKRDGNVSAALEKWQAQGMQFRAHHAFVWDTHRPFNLAAAFDADYFGRLTDWLARHQIMAYSVHAGSYSTPTDKPRAYSQLLEHLERLHSLCQARAIALGVETMDRLPTSRSSQNLLDNLADVEQFLQDAPDLKLVIDLAHLNLWHDTSIPEKLSLFNFPPERLLEVHVSDNDGKRDIHSRITNDTWWVPWRDRIPLSVPIMLENRCCNGSVNEMQQTYQEVLALFSAPPSRVPDAISPIVRF